jgi:hypothetical protein
MSKTLDSVSCLEFFSKFIFFVYWEKCSVTKLLCEHSLGDHEVRYTYVSMTISEFICPWAWIVILYKWTSRLLDLLVDGESFVFKNRCLIINMTWDIHRCVCELIFLVLRICQNSCYSKPVILVEALQGLLS